MEQTLENAILVSLPSPESDQVHRPARLLTPQVVPTRPAARGLGPRSTAHVPATSGALWPTSVTPGLWSQLPAQPTADLS